jgi:N-glycosylase/DNA lyase
MSYAVGYHKTDVFPVDTWIKKVFTDNFGEEIAPEKMSKLLAEKYGDLAGFAQQYLFYYKRSGSDLL